MFRRGAVWLVFAMALVFAPAALGQVVINEVLYDTTTGTGAFTELFGPPGFSLGTFILNAIDGDTGTSYAVIPLNGLTIPADGYLVIAADGSVPNLDVIMPEVDWQDGPDGLVLMNIVTPVDSLCYGSSPLLDCEGDPAPDVASDFSLSRGAGSADSDNNAADFIEATPTPGGPFTGTVVCEAPSGLTCLSDCSTGAVILSWNNESTYFDIEILRDDNVVVASGLTGDTESFVDPGVPAGSHGYEVFVTCALGLMSSTNCTVDHLPGLGDVRINEIRIDEPGSDLNEYIELVGTPGVGLGGLTYLIVGDGTGGSGVVEEALPLDGLSLDGDGFCLIAEPSFALGGTPQLLIDLNLENSDNVTHFLVSGFTGDVGDDLDANDDGTLDNPPWDDVLDVIAVIEEENPPSGTEHHYGPPVVGPNGAFSPGHVLRCPDRVGPWTIGAFDLLLPPFADTPGSPNDCVPRRYESPPEEPPASPCTCNRCGQGDEKLPDADAANSVYLFSGEFFHNAVDMQILGRGLDFVWARKYRSRHGPDTAQGNGWDFSYNVYIEADGNDVLVHDGNSRVDRYVSRADGTYTLESFFREGAFDPSGFFTLTFADGGSWLFQPLDGSPAEGKLCAITDRNGNALGFEYDGLGRLTTVRDTLDTVSNPRTVQVAYDANGFIESITDYTGRTVTYEYYDGVEPGGNFGDLKAVTGPPVTGTPNGNDFPNGKRTVYTYSTGLPEADLNGNLLTITDPRNSELSGGFTRGDCNIDGVIDISDPILLLDAIFVAPQPFPCEDACDFNDGGEIDIADPIGALVYLFSGGPPPPPPVDCGEDPTPDPLDCALLPTCPVGRPYLTNEYATTTTAGDLEFDRVLGQIWGDPGDRIDIVYAAEVPTQQNGLAVQRAVVNDRVGNVSEYLYDALNRLVVTRSYTGRWDPDLPVTNLASPDTPRLRVEDPPFFANCYTWNDDSLLTSIVKPAGNAIQLVYEYDLDPSAPWRTRGNLRERHYFAGGIASDQTVISEYFEYESGLGGCCGANFVTRHVDGRGNETLHSYDANGNRIQTEHRIPGIFEDFQYNSFGQLTRHTHPDNDTSAATQRREDAFTYYTESDGHLNGYLKEQIIDDTGFAMTTTYDYDDRGNRTVVTDPTGNSELFTYNSLDQVVRHESREVFLAGSFVRYGMDTFYDGNENIVRIDRDNLDEDGVPYSNAILTTWIEHDILNAPILKTEEVTAFDFVITEHQYDGNRNVTRTLYGEATNGNDPFNHLTTSYDERDLPYQETRALGSPVQSTRQLDYDLNGNSNRITSGLEDTAPRVQIMLYDGFDRLVSTTDAMGNVESVHYDRNGNVLSKRIDGELDDVPGQAANTRLIEVELSYDALDRKIEGNVHHFRLDGTQAAIGDGLSTTATTYNDASLIATTTDDNGNTTTFEYDSANRLVLVTDSKGNESASTYDDNSNLLQLIETDVAFDGSTTTYTTDHTYDGLDRLVTKVDNYSPANTLQFEYDSRDNEVFLTDAEGKFQRKTYDGLSRELSKTIDMDGNGPNGGGDDITLSNEWDDSSRVISQVDDKGGTTRYEYDSLDRIARTINPDGTEEILTYDAHNNKITRTDPNASVTTYTYDSRNRVIDKLISPGPIWVEPAITFESYDYDGLDNVVHGENNNTINDFVYDSMGAVISETQVHDWAATPISRTIDCVYDGEGNETMCDYPSGVIITTSYDELNRPEIISDQSGDIAIYRFDGPLVEEREYPGPGILGVMTYDSARRPTSTTYSDTGGGEILDDRTYEWDGMYNKTRRTDVRPGGPQLDHGYAYDDAYRLVSTSVTNGSGSTVRTTSYDLDGVGNRQQVTGTNTECLGAYGIGLPGETNELMNQYDSTPCDTRQYDPNGNLVFVADAGGNTTQHFYDYRDELVRTVVTTVSPPSTTTLLYTYDTLGRRVKREVLGSNPGTTHYFLHGDQVIEEQDGSGNLLATYVFGIDIDEPIRMQRGGNDYYYLQDDQYNVMALCDGVGNVVERYEYGDFGQIVDPTTGMLIPNHASSIENPYFFMSRWRDPITDLYYFRTRFYEPGVGRFISRDSIGTWGDRGNLGNAQSFVHNNPFTHRDPHGLAVIAGLAVAGELCFNPCNGNASLGGSLWLGVKWEQKIWKAKISVGWGFSWTGTFFEGHIKRLHLLKFCGDCKEDCGGILNLKIGPFKLTDAEVSFEKKVGKTTFALSVSADLENCGGVVKVGVATDITSKIPYVGKAKAALDLAKSKVPKNSKTYDRLDRIKLEFVAGGSARFTICASSKGSWGLAGDVAFCFEASGLFGYGLKADPKKND